MIGKPRKRDRRDRINDIVAVAGSDWAKVWDKLGIEPTLNGSVLVAELELDGKPVFPLQVSLGYSERRHVVDALCRQLRLTVEHAEGFIRCTHDFASVVEAVLQEFLIYVEED